MRTIVTQTKPYLTSTISLCCSRSSLEEFDQAVEDSLDPSK